MRLFVQSRGCKDLLSKAEHLRAVKRIIVKICLYKILVLYQKMLKKKSKINVRLTGEFCNASNIKGYYYCT